jgi:hypothetical protein
MSYGRVPQSDRKTQAAIKDLERQIRRRYPGVRFEVVEGNDSDGVYLQPTLDLDDLDELFDQDLLDRLYDIQVEQGLSVYVLPVWPAERVARELAKRKAGSVISDLSTVS